MYSWSSRSVSSKMSRARILSARARRSMMMSGGIPDDTGLASHEPHPDDDCEDCVADKGLCDRHAWSVLPQRTRPSWHRHAHSGVYREAEETGVSAAGQRLIRRKERKRLERLRLFAELLAKPDAA